ncbi:MAG TPA: helix-turn-helix domain-containing GNAT family N-acetyltransferase [Roseiarcus sp.]|nr:helix-turn-helix domain-containing GNAT family N-acetyltransferase [Roseiarcus sp.]
MDRDLIRQVRSFNRRVTRRIGALEESYLSRGRPLSEARLIFEIGVDGANLRALRDRLGLDSGYLSRLLQSLEAQRLVEIRRPGGDGRLRRVSLTGKGRTELAAYDRLSDGLAASMLERLDPAQRESLVRAMAEAERLMKVGSVEIAIEAPDSAEARRCLNEYFRELSVRFDGGYDPAKQSPAGDDMTPPAGFFVLARLDGEAVGCGALKRLDRTTGEIKRVWTSSSARRLGIARNVLRTLEAAARDLGLKRLRLDTNRALTEARDLYRKAGYKEIGRYNDNPYAHHWFEKRLLSRGS